MMSDNSSDNTIVDLGKVISIVSSVQRVVADFYGPQCTQTLLTSQTGKAVVTSDGFCILEALQPSHPIAQIVFKALKSCHSVTQDGSKSFLLYLAYFLLHLQEEINIGRFCCDGTNLNSSKCALERRGVIFARKYVRHLKQIVLPKLCDRLQLHGEMLIETMLQNINIVNVMKNTLQTAMMSHYNPRLCEHFADLLISSLPISSPQSTLLQALQYLVDNFFKITMKVSNQPYGGSTVADLFLLNRKFTLKCDNLLSLKEASVLILKGNIDGCTTGDEPQETYIVQQGCQVVNLLQHRRKMVETFAHKLKVKKIDLIICTEGIPGYALDVFRRHNICVIANVTNEDAELIGFLTQTLSLNYITDCVGDSHIIHLSGIHEVVIGGKVFVQLDVTNVVYPLKHLIVCAPTVGLCDQLAIALHKALNALKMCFVHGDCQKTKCIDKDSQTNCVRDNTDEDLQPSERDIVKVVLTVQENDMLKVDLSHGEKDVKKVQSVQANDKVDQLSEENDMVKSDQLYEENEMVKSIQPSEENDMVKSAQPSEEKDMVKPDQPSEENAMVKSDQLSEEKLLIKVVPTAQEKGLVKVNQFSISAFSESFQYTSTLEESQNLKLRVIEGGGCFEIIVAEMLQDFRNTCSDPDLMLICKVMEKSMFSVVKKLFENTTIQPENKRRFLEVKTELNEKFSCGQLWGLNRRGMPCNLTEKGVIEPLSSKIHVMQCVLSLVDQLLGIDKIVSVRKPEQ